MNTEEQTVAQNDARSEPVFSRRIMLSAAALILFVLALYAPTVRCQFLNYYDDEYVTANAYVAKGVTAPGLHWALTNTAQAGLWQPLTWISHMLDVSAFDMNPAGH